MSENAPRRPKKIPMVPVKTRPGSGAARKFFFAGGIIMKLNPSLAMELKQAKIDIPAREYAAFVALTAVFYFFLFGSLIVFLAWYANFLTQDFIEIAIGIAGFMGFFTMIYVYNNPKLQISRKVKNLEKDLLFAMRHLYIQVKSGVTLFDAMVSVSAADYGVISEEFEESVKEINGGVPQIDALENMAWRNPSLFFRRVIWQVVNAMRAGTDIGTVLKEILNALGTDQRLEIRRYGAQLNPLALVYMMSSVIVPSLGITFMITLSIFIGFLIPFDIFLLLILVFL